jgi:hypothetical protein
MDEQFVLFSFEGCLMSKNKKRGFKEEHILLQEGKKKIYCYLVPRRYPLVLLVKVGRRQVRAFGSE